MISYFVGWDVGGWNCDRNNRSRDAVVILDEQLQIVGVPWRGNMRVTLNEAASSREWVCALFDLCQADLPSSSCVVTIGIDTPLGFSRSFLDLTASLKSVAVIGESGTNPYLFRATERFLFERGITPLSAIKDMIGSQATKGMHALAKFAPNSVSCGVWTDSDVLTAVEAYPSPCKRSVLIQSLRQGYPLLKHEDEEDALTCALIAYLHATQPGQLIPTPDDVPDCEGWIWLPKDCLS